MKHLKCKAIVFSMLLFTFLDTLALADVVEIPGSSKPKPKPLPSYYNALYGSAFAVVIVCACILLILNTKHKKNHSAEEEKK